MIIRKFMLADLQKYVTDRKRGGRAPSCSKDGYKCRLPFIARNYEDSNTVYAKHALWNAYLLEEFTGNIQVLFSMDVTIFIVISAMIKVINQSSGPFLSAQIFILIVEK